MIKINKDLDPPIVRFVHAGHPFKGCIKWIVATRSLLLDYNNNPATFQADYKFKHDYGCEDYRRALLKCQGPKCCFCERPIFNGQIEHYRPKNGWQQARGKGNPIVKPGYYWLAYKWDNMLISCSECNHSGQKGNLFPVDGFRATDHTMDYKNEVPTIINPAKEDPSIYISFNKEVPVGIDANGRGDENIAIFKLKDRADLKQCRSERFELYSIQKLIADLDRPIKTITQTKIDEARIFLQVAQSRKQPFAGMIRENIKKGII